MKAWLRLTLATLLGLSAGTGLAIWQVRGGLAAGQVTNGPWATAKTYGTRDADVLTRARVALSGLLALPAKEAMYFTAKTDSAGRPLEGRCTYELAIPPIAARWWSVTAYEGEGWLIPNPQNTYSAGSGSLPPNSKPMIVVSPRAPTDWGAWTGKHISTGNAGSFDLTLRIYHPDKAILAHPETAVLPPIERVACK
jgi:hypothetical protein